MRNDWQVGKVRQDRNHTSLYSGLRLSLDHLRLYPEALWLIAGRIEKATVWGSTERKVRHAGHVLCRFE